MARMASKKVGCFCAELSVFKPANYSETHLHDAAVSVFTALSEVVIAEAVYNGENNDVLDGIRYFVRRMPELLGQMATEGDRAATRDGQG